MKQLVILSGKGGTGKTTVAAALAHLASQEAPIVMADADVDAANLELVLDPRQVEAHDLTGGSVAVIDPAADRIEISIYKVPPFDGPALAVALDALDPGRYSGVAVVATESVAVRDALARLRRYKIPVVTLVSGVPGADFSNFRPDRNAAAGGALPKVHGTTR